jgi:membrane-associated protein
MSSADIGLVDELLAMLGGHHDAAYTVLFLGAFFETLIPFSLAVVGEVFFLAGALLAGVGTLELWAVMAVLYGGGLLGDNASYWIGRHYGDSLFDRLARWPLVRRLARPDNYRKGVAFFRRHGALAVFMARLSGPLSWVMPAMAGTFRLNYATFLRFNTLGVILGISQFIVLGYFFGNHLAEILGWLDRYGIIIAAGVFTIATAVAWRYLSASRGR